VDAERRVNTTIASSLALKYSSTLVLEKAAMRTSVRNGWLF
jgi:hypothetical protein